jgi:hypothetical protein
MNFLTMSNVSKCQKLYCCENVLLIIPIFFIISKSLLTKTALSTEYCEKKKRADR